ncbi:hypothetical protein SteCoe_19035 [Stentor coeruleus]|uniref:Zinc/iron permease n=1 Tax=Stentor coeruleus TaxID=5963 RepID=A0A1R2BV33_9CILI|nr:hypothetical protein SteCoe_19035 [Stentor coeruleus]
MNELTAIKVIFIFVMFFSAAIAGSVPIFSKSFRNNKKLISTGNCFAAGIFLIVGVVHLLRESQESFEEALKEEMPVGYVVALGGYTMILFIENILFGGHNHDIEEPSKNQGSLVNERSEIVILNKEKPLEEEFARPDPQPECENAECPVTKPHASHNEYIPGIILTTALIVHSIFEGIAGGLLTTKSSVISVGIAILIHNIPAAIALGVKLEKASKTVSIILMFLFVLSSPLGIAIGISLSELAYPIIRAIFLSISAGTFIYIGCTEILAEEMHDKSNKILKFTGFIVGFVPLAMAAIFIKEED